MICSEQVVKTLKDAGFDVFTGVPCSYLTPLINRVIDSPDVRYVPATNEGDAVAIAAGAELGGRRGVVMMQNSGLGNAVSPLTSLTAIFRIPLLMITTWRGQPGGPADEPQHRLMGEITTKLIELMDIPWELFPQHEDELAPALQRAVAHMDSTGMPYGLVMTKGTIEPYALQSTENGREGGGIDAPNPMVIPVERWEQDAVLRTISSTVGDGDLVVATTGFTGRALYAVADRPNQLYMVGSMGCLSSFALGLALAQPSRRVIALDGDGAFLMRMGALAAIAHERPKNLVHVLLDNGVHDSTGSQATVSQGTDPALVAHACGYPRVLRPTGLEELGGVLRESDDLTFVHLPTQPRSNRKLPRPDITPEQVARRLQTWLESPTAGCENAVHATVGAGSSSSCRVGQVFAAHRDLNA